MKKLKNIGKVLAVAALVSTSAHVFAMEEGVGAPNISEVVESAVVENTVEGFDPLANVVEPTVVKPKAEEFKELVEETECDCSKINHYFSAVKKFVVNNTIKAKDFTVESCAKLGGKAAGLVTSKELSDVQQAIVGGAIVTATAAAVIAKIVVVAKKVKKNKKK